MYCFFKNDNNCKINLIPDHPFTQTFVSRDNHEVLFRRIHSYMINQKIIKNNIIDLGAWMGDNSIPWAKQIDGKVYAIDPSPNNINFINQMCQVNSIDNIKTIQKAVGDTNEIISTDGGLDHCSFQKGQQGKNKVECVTLDYLLEMNEINNIGYIHLDVESFEFNVIKGATRLIEKCRPIITFEQHIELDDYLLLSQFVANKNYDVYIINETLLRCRYDCRNFLAFPRELNIDIEAINKHIGKKILIMVSYSNKNNDLTIYNKKFIGTLYGEYLSGKEFKNIVSVKDPDNDRHIFAIHDNLHTKFVAVDDDGKWMDAKYMLSFVNIHDSKNVIDSFISADYRVAQNHYNVKNLITI